MEAIGLLMFCPGCGEMAIIREGDGKSVYPRIESSINPFREDYENDKPNMDDYNPEDLSRKIPREDEITLVDSPVSGGTSLRPKKTDYQIDYDDWLALDELVPRFKNVDMGDEIEKKGVKYSTCMNPYCNYNGPAAKVKKDGKEIDFDDLTSKDEVKTRDYEVIKDSDKMQGILTKDTYMCSKRLKNGKSCDSTEVYAYLEQTRSSDEPETRMLTCKACGHGWREY